MKLLKSILLALLITFIIIALLYSKAFEVQIFSITSIIAVVVFTVVFSLFTIFHFKTSIKENKTSVLILSSIGTGTVYLTIAIYFILLFSILYYAKANTNTWFISSSIDGKHSIKVVTVGSAWPFKDQDLIIYANNKSLYETSIANDGKTLHNQNYLIEWDNNVAVLSFYGEEQYNEIITITFEDNKVFYVSQRDSVSRTLRTFDTFQNTLSFDF